MKALAGVPSPTSGARSPRPHVKRYSKEQMLALWRLNTEAPEHIQALGIVRETPGRPLGLTPLTMDEQVDRLEVSPADLLRWCCCLTNPVLPRP